MRARLILAAVLCSASFAWLAVAGAHAAEISLVPTSAVSGLETGQTVAFDVVMDFSTDQNGLGSDLTLGGGFDVTYDAAHLQLVDFTSASLGDPDFERNPDVSLGLLQSRAFGDFEGLVGPALVGTLTFEVIDVAPATSFVSTSPTSGVGGPFVSGIDFNTQLSVGFDDVEVTSVPEASFGALTMSGTGALMILARRRRKDARPA